MVGGAIGLSVGRTGLVARGVWVSRADFAFSLSSPGQKSHSATAAITSTITITSGQFRLLNDHDDPTCAVSGVALAETIAEFSPDGVV